MHMHRDSLAPGCIQLFIAPSFLRLNLLNSIPKWPRSRYTAYQFSNFGDNGIFKRGIASRRREYSIRTRGLSPLFIVVITAKCSRLNPPLICLILKLRLPSTRDDGNQTDASNTKRAMGLRAKVYIIERDRFSGAPISRLRDHGYFCAKTFQRRCQETICYRDKFSTGWSTVPHHGDSQREFSVPRRYKGTPAGNFICHRIGAHDDYAKLSSCRRKNRGTSCEKDARNSPCSRTFLRDINRAAAWASAAANNEKNVFTIEVCVVVR